MLNFWIHALLRSGPQASVRAEIPISRDIMHAMVRHCSLGGPRTITRVTGRMKQRLGVSSPTAQAQSLQGQSMQQIPRIAMQGPPEPPFSSLSGLHCLCEWLSAHTQHRCAVCCGVVCCDRLCAYIGILGCVHILKKNEFHLSVLLRRNSNPVGSCGVCCNCCWNSRGRG